MPIYVYVIEQKSRTFRHQRYHCCTQEMKSKSNRFSFIRLYRKSNLFKWPQIYYARPFQCKAWPSSFNSSSESRHSVSITSSNVWTFDGTIGLKLRFAKKIQSPLYHRDLRKPSILVDFRFWYINFLNVLYEIGNIPFEKPNPTQTTEMSPKYWIYNRLLKT